MGSFHTTQRHVRRPVTRRLAALAAASALGVAGAVVATPALAASATTRGSSPAALVRHLPPARTLPASLLRAPSRPAPAAPSVARRPEGTEPSDVRPRGVTPIVFTVTVLADSPLFAPSSHACADAATHACSLRAAVQAANNLDKPVVIKLGAHTYQMTDATDATLEIENPGGTTIEGVSAAATRILVPSGDDYGAFGVEPTTDSGSSATFSDLTISGGDTPSSYGGAVFVDGFDAAAILDDVDLTHNTAEYGGGIGCYYGSIWITDSMVNSNSAVEGGGLYEYFCNVMLARSTFNADQATSTSASAYGGGLYVYYGSTHATDCQANGDTAGSATETGEGGGVYDYYGTLVMSATEVDHDTALDVGEGGGAYVSFASLDATNSTFSFDRAGGGADAAGGGIAAYEDATVVLHGVAFDHDTTSATDDDYGGGGIWAYGYEEPLLIKIDSHSSFLDATTGAIIGLDYYGGVDLDVSDTSFTSNSSTLEAAGAIYQYGYEYGSSTTQLTDDSFVGNRDNQDYSAGAVEVYAGEYEGATLDVSGCTVKGNIASGEYGTGGIAGLAAYYYATVSVRVSGSSITANHAPDAGAGGGVSLWEYEGDASGALELDHDTITGNTAGSTTANWEGDGGGVYAQYEVALTVTDCTISGNSAIGGGTDSGDGGGIYADTYEAATIDGSTFTGNHAAGAASEGGGIYAYPEYGALELHGSTVDANTAIYGGGAYVYYYNLDVSATTFADNVAGTPVVAGDGGAVFTYDDVASFSNSTFTGNEAMSSHSAPGEGGAFYNEEYTYALYYVTVAGNVARQGAAYYADSDGSGFLRDSIVVDNVNAPKSKTDADCGASAHDDLFVSLGGNVLSNGSCVETATATDVLTATPGLLALAANGGPTKTMALLATSPAINAAHGDCLATDQRGIARPTTGRCDSGAYELVKAPKPTKH